jgi:hypothetical protein
MKIKPTPKGLERFRYFSLCADSKRLPPLAMDLTGYTASECFHAHETYGKTLPCREPELLARALNGKEWHGLTVTMVAEDLIAGLCSAAEIRSTYPVWVVRDILGRAGQLAHLKLGFVPRFIREG